MPTLYACIEWTEVYTNYISDTTGLHASLSRSPFIWHRPCVNFFFVVVRCFHFCFCLRDWCVRVRTTNTVTWAASQPVSQALWLLVTAAAEPAPGKYSESNFIFLTIIAPVCCRRVPLCARTSRLYWLYYYHSVTKSLQLYYPCVNANGTEKQRNNTKKNY